MSLPVSTAPGREPERNQRCQCWASPSHGEVSSADQGTSVSKSTPAWRTPGTGPPARRQLCLLCFGVARGLGSFLLPVNGHTPYTALRVCLQRPRSVPFSSIFSCGRHSVASCSAPWVGIAGTDGAVGPDDTRARPTPCVVRPRGRRSPHKAGRNEIEVYPSAGSPGSSWGASTRPCS